MNPCLQRSISQEAVQFPQSSSRPSASRTSHIETQPTPQHHYTQHFTRKNAKLVSRDDWM